MSITLEDLSPGDVVCLRSARYMDRKIMMVVGLVVDARAAKDTGLSMGVHCDWHDTQHRPRTAVYHSNQLVIIQKASHDA